MWNLVEPQLLTVEPLCGTLWNLNFQQWNLYVEPCGTSTFNSGTFMWNLLEPELLRMEPLCGTSRNLVPDFGRLPQTTPKLYWKNPKPFRLLGNNKPTKNLQTSIKTFKTLLKAHPKKQSQFLKRLIFRSSPPYQAELVHCRRLRLAVRSIKGWLEPPKPTKQIQRKGCFVFLGYRIVGIQATTPKVISPCENPTAGGQELFFALTYYE